MSTNINITVGGNGLLQQSAQFTQANRQAQLQRTSRAAVERQGVTALQQERIAQGRDPVTGAPLAVPNSSSSAMARFGPSRTPRINQQVGASRRPTAGVEWNCTYAEPAYANDLILDPAEQAYASAFTCPFQKKGGKYPGSASALAADFASAVGWAVFRRTNINGIPYLEAVPVTAGTGGIIPNVGLYDASLLGPQDLTFDLFVNPRLIQRSLGISVDTFSFNTSLMVKPPIGVMVTTFIVNLLDSTDTGSGTLGINYTFRVNIESETPGDESLVRFTATATGYDTFVYTILGPPVSPNAIEDFSMSLRKIADSYYITMLKNNTAILNVGLPFSVVKRDCKPSVAVQVFSRVPDDFGVGSVGSVLFGPLSAKFT
jgi:hypothetical protein